MHLGAFGIWPGSPLEEPGCIRQWQLDWILGVNPFDASTMTGVGQNQPKQFVTGEFKPVTPLIDDAVMNGIGGTPDDAPGLKPGSWQTCEYWTPTVCYTMWLMSELAIAAVQHRCFADGRAVLLAEQ